MLPQIRLSRSGLETSRLGLGTSRLHYISSDAGRAALIHGALDTGVRHFDTARLYGDGLAERALGRALKGRRHQASIATKFGLLPSRAIEMLGPLAQSLRIARALCRKAGLFTQPRRSWTPATLDSNLAASLRALDTDYIDILFLHDARAGEIVGHDDLAAALLAARQGGKVRHLGITGDPRDAAVIMAAFPGLFDVVQAPENTWDETLIPDFTFGALSQCSQNFGAGKLEAGQAEAGLLRALARRPSGAVLVGTSRLANLQALVRAAAVS